MRSPCPRPNRKILILGERDLCSIMEGWAKSVTILYDDQHLLCDDDALIIYWYYFPIGSKRIPYTSIRSVTDEPMDFWSGKGRIWGMGLAPEWFHLDANRMAKHRRLVIDDGAWVKSVITPENIDAVLAILQTKTART